MEECVEQRVLPAILRKNLLSMAVFLSITAHTLLMSHLVSDTTLEPLHTAHPQNPATIL